MKNFSVLKSVAAPLDRANVDTDQIIPKQFLRSIKKSGFGPFLFDEWRYLDRGELGMDCSTRPVNPDFSLNDKRYADAKIFLTRENFGCGSSREHAVWALMDYGFDAVIAPSFGDIFRNNAIKNGLLPVILSADEVEALFCQTQDPDSEKRLLTIDLAAQSVTIADGRVFSFAIVADEKKRLLEGLDDIAITLQKENDIRRYEEWRRRLEPWVFDNDKAQN